MLLHFNLFGFKILWPRYNEMMFLLHSLKAARPTQHTIKCIQTFHSADTESKQQNKFRIREIEHRKEIGYVEQSGTFLMHVRFRLNHLPLPWQNDRLHSVWYYHIVRCKKETYLFYIVYNFVKKERERDNENKSFQCSTAIRRYLPVLRDAKTYKFHNKTNSN